MSLKNELYIAFTVVLHERGKRGIKQNRTFTKWRERWRKYKGDGGLARERNGKERENDRNDLKDGVCGVIWRRRINYEKEI